jgi:hypothetical protein
MQISVPQGSPVLSIGPNGELTSSLTVHILLDVFPYWLEITLGHLEEVESLHQDVLRAWGSPDDEALVRAMEAEFTAAMQCIMAAIAIDAFYAAVKRHIELPESLTAAWRNKRTARHRQITEVLRRAFVISPNGGRQLRDIVRELFRYRDLAVHPSAGSAEPVWHPDLNFGAEWRFVAFRLHNAKALAGATLSVIAQLLSRPRSTYPRLATYAAAAGTRIGPIVERWEARYGQLLRRDADPQAPAPPQEGAVNDVERGSD